MATINFIEGSFKIMFASKNGGSQFNDHELRRSIESFLKEKGFKILTDDLNLDSESFDIDTNEAIDIVENTFNSDPEDCGFIKTWELDEDQL